MFVGSNLGPGPKWMANMLVMSHEPHLDVAHNFLRANKFPSIQLIICLECIVKIFLSSGLVNEIEDESLARPLIKTDQCTFAYIKHSNIYIVATSRTNSNIALLFSLLYKIRHVMQVTFWPIRSFVYSPSTNQKLWFVLNIHYETVLFMLNVEPPLTNLYFVGVFQGGWGRKY